MTNSLFSEQAFGAAKFALNGLSRRQEAIGRNLANVDTPGYKAVDLNFENALKLAMNQSNKTRLLTTHVSHMTAPGPEYALELTSRIGGAERADGNNVDIDTELYQMAETGIRYQALTQSISKKLVLLRAIATDR